MINQAAALFAFNQAKANGQDNPEQVLNNAIGIDSIEQFFGSSTFPSISNTGIGSLNGSAGIDPSSGEGWPFGNGNSNEIFQKIDPLEAMDTLLESAKRTETAPMGTYTSEIGKYHKAMAPNLKNVLLGIQNNKPDQIRKALNFSIDAALKYRLNRSETIRTFEGKQRSKDKANAEANAYRDALDRIDLNDPRAAFELFTQTMMWTQGGSLSQSVFNIAQEVEVNTMIMNPENIGQQNNSFPIINNALEFFNVGLSN